MSVATYSKAGSKATTPAKLDKAIFGVEVKNHQLLKDAYLSYLAGGRDNYAQAKKRGQVRGGGRKPWRQKGTGNARFGSSRNPIWRGGGVAFGPTGEENFTRQLNGKAKQAALRQALSLAAKGDRIAVIDDFESKDGKVKPALALLKKIGAKGRTVIIVASVEPMLSRATNNLKDVISTTAANLNVYDVMNADQIVISKPALEALSSRLGGAK